MKKKSTKEDAAAIKERTKIATPADPMEDESDGEPPRESTGWYYWAYGNAFAKGCARASGAPCTRPTVAGPKDIMVRLLRKHCKDENDKLLKGEAVIEWLENVAFDFRSRANEKEYGYGSHGWSPYALSKWLDKGRPVLTLAKPTPSRAHIAVKKG